MLDIKKRRKERLRIVTWKKLLFVVKQEVNKSELILAIQSNIYVMQLKPLPW
jgi:hypothetical protein